MLNISYLGIWDAVRYLCIGIQKDLNIKVYNRLKFIMDSTPKSTFARTRHIFWLTSGEVIGHFSSLQYNIWEMESWLVERCYMIIFFTASHQTWLDTRSKARRPIKVGIKGRGMPGTSRGSNPAGLCCSSTHQVQCGSNEPSSFTNPNLGYDIARSMCHT